MSKFDRFVDAAAFWRWSFFILLVIGVAAHFSTLTYSPVPWIDEVQIVEIGQGGIGEKTSGWSMCTTGVPEYDAQAWAPYYLGGWCEEMCYQAVGRFGPRSFTLFGLFVATLLFYAYVRRRTDSDFWATVLGIAFFAFPALVQSVRGARVDVWALACLWASLNLLYEVNRSNGWKRYVRYALAGSAAVLGCFFWASAALLGPIYIWAFFENFEHPVKEWKSWVSPAASVVAGALAAAAIVLIPFYGKLTTTLEMAAWVSQHNSNPATVANIQSALVSFLKTVFGFPFVFLIGLGGIFAFRKTWWLKAGVLGMFIVCVFIAARIYVFRMLYLSAYAFIGLLLLSAMTCRWKRWGKVCAALLLLISAISFGRSVVLRNGIEYLARNGRDYHELRDALEREIGRDAIVYSDSFQVYYAGRDLGWKLYRDGFGIMDNVPRGCWSSIKYVVIDGDTPISSSFLREAGFTACRKLDIERASTSSVEQKMLAIARRSVGYGPFLIYSREKRMMQ